MKNSSPRTFGLFFSALLLLASHATAATVEPGIGYTNAFTTQPPAADWATLSVAGAGTNIYDLDTDVNANTTTTGVIDPTTSNANNPPGSLATATWSANAAGHYLQTRPTGNLYTLLMGKFVNNTGSNATQISLSYLLTMAGNLATEDADKGTRVYFSFTGLVNSWTNLPTLNNVANSGSFVLSTNLALNWPNGAKLYLLWADDNAAVGTDTANQIDNFSLRVTAGTPLTTELGAVINTPTNNALYLSGASITASASTINGIPPYTVEYYRSTGAGNKSFSSVGSSPTAPYTLNLGALSAGVYNIYAYVTDQGGDGVAANSVTNTFSVLDRIVFMLTAPAEGATFDDATSVTGTTTLSGGTTPYSVQFFLDNVPNGAPVVAPPYERNFGVLFVGDHTIKATVTDARGWVSNSVARNVHVTGSLAATLSPTNGTSYNFGQALILSAVAAGGTAPYATTFYNNGALAGSFNSPPFTTNLGLLPVGSYTCYVHAADSSIPAAQQANSFTNVITILPNPLVANLTLPANGQTATASQPFTMTAAATVGAPVTVSSMEFFFDGVSVGVDTTAPFTGSAASPSVGDHTAYAVATDSLGRKSNTATNLVTFVVDPLANNNFANRFVLSTPASVTGNNTGANTQGGEPGFQFGGGLPTIIWGATLWYQWVAPFSSTVTIDTFGSSINTVLSVYTGTAVNALTLVQRNDNANGSTTASLVSFSAVAGTEYQIQLGGQGGFGSPVSQGAVQLNLSVPAVVNITSPTNGSVYLAGNSINVSVAASSIASTITKVDLYDGATFVGTASTAPYTFVITNAPPGSNSIIAVATDSLSQVVTSGVVRVLVANPGITITSPSEDSIFQGTNPITVSVYGLLPAGSITNVNFFVDGQPFGEDATVPFSAVWTNVTGGSHRLTATGRDDSGNSYVATPVNFGVGQVIVHSNAVWKYLDNGSDQGTAWRALGFNDSTWASGPAELGYGDSDEATVVSGGTAGAFFATTYFRRAFVVTNIHSFASLSVLIAYDDAGVVFLNGKEVFRAGDLPSVVNYDTFASGAAVEETIVTGTISATNLVEGTNIIAVEIHQQAANSSDISFYLQLVGAPVIIHNVSPMVALTNPANDQNFIAPVSITIEAAASDADGSVRKVEFFTDAVKLGETTNSPYSFVWQNPPVGAHTLTIVATDDLNGATTSAPVPIVVYDNLGRPVAQIIAPANGAIIEGPTNLLLTATAHGLSGITNVLFLANGVEVGNASDAPYSVVWASSFLSNGLVAIASDANGVLGTSPVVSVTITIPPTNTVAPIVARQIPLAFTTVTNLTNITVTFSERVQNVDAGDLLINGIPATGVTGGGSNYTFTFLPQPYGEVEVGFAAGHGITDFGYPYNLPFNELTPEAAWEYNYIDVVRPTVLAHVPATGAAVSNLTTVSVTFSEPVTGVDAADLLINGSPAFGLNGSGASYIFDVIQPASGTVNITWATNHGITDLAGTPNTFNRTGTGATWSFALDSRTVLVQTNSLWKFIKGTAEASDPTNAWRQAGFDDSSWSNSLAPFVYGEPTFTNALNPGTDVSDMASNAYSSVYLRKKFVIANLNSVTNLLLSHQSDDGFIAWINGVEVFRYNMPAGLIPYNGSALTTAPESGNNAGAAYIVVTLTNALAALVNGTNTLAVHAFNVVTNPASSDFVFNAQLYTYVSDTAFAAPRVVSALPAQGDVFSLSNVTINFSESVANVDAADLLVNGLPAATMSSTTNTTYTFQFAQPAYGAVTLTWTTNHGIVDFDTPPKPFSGTAASSVLRYTLVNPSASTILSQTPLGGTVITGLTSITIAFSEGVAGVEASDLLVNGTPASGLASTTSSNYTFTFPQPAFGSVAVRWATNHGIQDLEAPANSFEPSRPGHTWNYTLVNPVPSVALSSPTNNTYVLAPANLTLRATATDNDGTISLVEFFAGSNKLGEATNAPYTFAWSNAPAATYLLRAIATDNSGLIGTSAPVVLNVVTSLPVVLTRGPYLQIGTPQSGLVRWRTDLFSDAVVTYGTDAASLTNLAVQSMLTNEHIVQVSGLQPDTKYFYSIGSSSQTLASGTNYWFITSPLPGTRKPTRLWVLGDSGTANANARAVRDAYYTFAATNRPADLWLMLGDNAYNSGTDAEHQTAVFDMYPTTLRNLFLWPTIGNHESAQSFTSTDFPYLKIFSLPHNGEAGGVPSGTQKYYSFDYANVHFISLDSMTSGRSGTSAMAEWLKNDLAGSAQEWTIVFFHHPPYTKGSHNSDAETELIEMRQNILPILEANGVDLVLSGHSHAFERSYLLNGHTNVSTTLTPAMKINGGNGREDGTGAYQKNAAGEGVVYTVAGSSGQTSGGSLNHPAHFVSLNELGSMVIDVKSNRLDAMFLTSGGASHDHFTLLKAVPPVAPANLIARALNANSIALTWNDVSTNESGYSIERSINGLDFARVATNAVNTTNALDSGLLANTTYFYRVRAFNAAGESDPSNVASVTSVLAAAAPAAPDQLIASAGSGTNAHRSQMTLRWRDRSANEAGFLIERSADGATFSAISSVGANVNLYVDRGLASATTYFYRVHSFNSLADSAPSNLDGDQTHPQSEIVASGESATFHAGVEGTRPIHYQWQFLGVPILSQTNEALTIPNAQSANEGSYTVAITDATGATISNPAWLYVLAPPLIVEDPLSRTNATGSTATFHVVAIGTGPLLYQWRRNGVSLPGAYGEELIIAAVTIADRGDYEVEVVNEFGAVTSHTAHLTVFAPPLAGADLFYRFRGQGLTVDVAQLLANDVDPEGTPLQITSVSSASGHGGTVSLNGNTVTYSPPGNFNDDDTFTYVVANASGATALGQVTVSLNDLRLRINPVVGGTNVVLSFTAAANFAYALEYTDALGTAWQPLLDFAAVSTNRVLQHTVSATQPMRFYRLRIGTNSLPEALLLNSIQPMSGGQVKLTFNASANQSCTVLFKARFSDALWLSVTNYPSVPTNRVLQLTTSAAGASGFYRLRSP